LEKLGLEKAKKIPYPVHISPTVLDKGLDRYLAYNIENEKEIFLQKPFTIQSLDKDINELLEKIRELEKEKGENQETIDNLQTQLNQIQNERDALPALPTLNDYQLLQTERDNARNHLGINNLNNLPELPAGETLISLLARPTLTQLNEKDQELITKNTQITGLTNDVNT